MPKHLRIIVCLLIVLLYACSSRESEPKLPGVRIVSLSPSITATLIDMGLSDHLVGCSAFCEKIGTPLPVVGDLYSIDYERLLRLQPTHVFLQQQTGGIDSHIEELARDNAFLQRSWELNTIADIMNLSSDLTLLLDVDQTKISFALEKSVISDEPTLLMTNGTDQNVGLCFGNNTYLDDIWSAMGGVNALKRDGWQMLSLEDIARLAPSRILIVSDVQSTSIGPVKSLGIPVIQFVHKDVLVPSTRIVQVAQSLQERLAK